MARIDDFVKESVFYLYPTAEAAEVGKEEGGTGFRVAVQSKAHSNRFYLYAISNSHVVHAPGYAPVIRTSTYVSVSSGPAKMGEREIIPLATNQWKAHPTDDLAIAYLGAFGPYPFFQPASIPSFSLLTREVIKLFDIGLGDEVYMVGRFVHHAGEYYNQPSARSGIISQMVDTIPMDDGTTQEAFLVEMRSISGHSGSPVLWKMPAADFLWDCFLSRAPEKEGVISTSAIIGRHMLKSHPNFGTTITGPWLLGVDCGSFKMWNPVYDGSQKTQLEAKSHAGLSIVIPGWKVQELLDLEEFVMGRKEEDEKETAKRQKSNVERDVSIPEGPLTRETFDDTLRRVSSRVSEPESEKKSGD